MFSQGYIRRNQRLISLIQITLDAVTIWVSFLIAVAIHAGFSSTLPRSYVVVMLMGSMFFYLIAVTVGFYTSWRSDSLIRKVSRIFQIWFFAAVAIILLGWALKSTDQFSRLILGTWFVLTPVLLSTSQAIVRSFLGFIRSQGRNTRRIAIAGISPNTASFIHEVEKNAWMGYILNGYYHPEASDLEGIDYLGGFDQLIQDVNDHQYDEIYITLPMTDELEIQNLVKSLSNCSVPVHIVPDLFIFSLLNSKISRIGSLPTVSVYDSPHDDLSAALKRAEDVILSSIILLFISPLMIFLAIAVKLTSKGPVFFKQRRYGIGGGEITVWKFRSMTVMEDGETVPQAQKNDSRITPLGNFMRKTSLDELPQFINVLQGSMSIVGPRPHAVAHNEKYRNDIHGYMLRHLVKPGITGWAQINGWRGETDTLEKMEKRIEFDLEYIKNWSILLDLKIIFLTIFKGFINKNAY